MRTPPCTSCALSFSVCIAVHSWHIAPVLWCGVPTAAAIVLMLRLRYAARKVIRLAQIGYPTAIVIVAPW